MLNELGQLVYYDQFQNISKVFMNVCLVRWSSTYFRRCFIFALLQYLFQMLFYFCAAPVPISDVVLFSFSTTFYNLSTKKETIVQQSFTVSHVLPYFCCWFFFATISFALLVTFSFHYGNIDQVPPDKLHGPMHYKISVTCVFNRHEIYTLL